jgi:twitching motility protein PilT
MPFVDRIIQFLQAQQGEKIVLENDQNCVVFRAGGTSGPVNQRLNGAQISGLVREILPEEHRQAFAAREPLLFEYPYGSGAMAIEVSQTPTSIRVSIGAPDSKAPAVAAAPEREGSSEPVYTGPTKRVQHMDELFQLIFDMSASDVHMNSNVKPFVRHQGVMKRLHQYEVNDPEHMKQLLFEIAPPRNQEEWERDHDTDFSYELPGVARFRCNLFADRHGPGGNFRLIPSKVATAADLNLTKEMLDLCFLSKGLVLVTGPTGTGKSTTLAALVDHVNKHRRDHIITIEDPIEFVHNNISCLVNQREVHNHTNSFARALRAALREDPDIVLVGEMRDLETVAIAIETAETGHLVFGTLHTSTAPSTVDRIIDQFPADQQEQIRVMLSESLKAVIAQTLCRTKDGKRVAAFEILLVDPATANLIREGKTFQIPSMMQIGKSRGCVTMNDSLLAHVKSGRVDPKEAYFRSAEKPGLLALFEAEDIKTDIRVVAS